MSGNVAALGHAFAPDEVIKNSFANFAFENFELAAYSGLITIAEMGHDECLPGLRMTLQEERGMADWIEANQPMIIRHYISLRESGEQAGR